MEKNWQHWLFALHFLCFLCSHRPLISMNVVRTLKHKNKCWLDTKKVSRSCALNGNILSPSFSLSWFSILFSFLNSQNRPGIQKCKAQNCRYAFLRHTPDAVQYWIHFVSQRTLCVVQLYIPTYTQTYCICLSVFVKFACRLSPVNHITYTYVIVEHKKHLNFYIHILVYMGYTYIHM